jgi:hypothetical protein
VRRRDSLPVTSRVGVRAGEDPETLVLRQPSRAARSLLARTGLTGSFEYVLAG